MSMAEFLKKALHIWWRFPGYSLSNLITLCLLSGCNHYPVFPYQFHIYDLYIFVGYKLYINTSGIKLCKLCGFLSTSFMLFNCCFLFFTILTIFKGDRSVTLSTFTLFRNYHHHSSPGLSSSYKLVILYQLNNTYPFLSTPAAGKHYLTFLPTGVTALAPQMNKIMKYLSFCDWFISFSMYSKYICAAECFRISFLLTLNINNIQIVCLYDTSVYTMKY